MNYITANQAAERWGVSEGIVRRYCRDERIPDAYQEFGTWYIPENAAKPTRKKKEASQLPKLLKPLLSNATVECTVASMNTCRSTWSTVTDAWQAIGSPVI